MDGLSEPFGYGTALFWVIITAASIAVMILAARAVRSARMRQRLRILAQPDTASSEIRRETIGQILKDTGYAYDEEKKIYYSVMNPWQREMGYCRLYDEWAIPIGLVFDSEPVEFEHNGKKWLVEFWKGQYGITVGGEIGIYNTAGPELHIPGVFHGTFYRSASDDETMYMEYTLYKNNRPLFSRAARHWWLTGFVLGEYADPAELVMEASVTFRDSHMREAFREALRGLGYLEEEIRCIGNTVRFIFAKPRSRQPWMRRSPINHITQRRNKALVGKYNGMTKGLDNIYDILNTLKVKSPLMYRLAVNTGKHKGVFKSFAVIRKYLT